MAFYKKSLLLFFLLILISLIIQAVSTSIIMGSSWPGEGDCQYYHNTIHLDAYYDPNAIITLDGRDNEDFWHVPGKNNSILIPVASDFYSDDFFVRYVNMSFVHSDTHLFILASWEDSTPLSNWDQFSMCWNINMLNYTAAFYQGMRTGPYGGGDVDTWQWGYRIGKENGSSYNGYDTCFGDDGWYPHNSEISQIETGMIYGTWFNDTNRYQIEISRPLTTGEQYDVQFEEKTIYEFTIAILDNEYGTGEGEDHAISWIYALHFSEFPTPLISGYRLGFTFLILIFLTGLIIIWKMKFIRIKNN